MRKQNLFSTAIAALTLSIFAVPASAATAEAWDSDSDGSLTNQEFVAGMDEAKIFESWDTDENGVLNLSELKGAIGDDATVLVDRFGVDFLGLWDADHDNVISETEFKESTFDAYDGDDNNVIEEPEFGDLNDDIGDGGFWDV